MISIVRRHSHSVGQSNPRNQNVYLADKFSSLAKVSIGGGCDVEGFVIQGKDLTLLAELFKDLELAVGTNSPKAPDYLVPSESSKGKACMLHNVSRSPWRDLRMASPQQREGVCVQKDRRGHETGSRLVKKRVVSRRAASTSAISSSERPA